jgi:hypothetical protein
MFFFTVKKSPAERAGETWPNELVECSRAASQLGKACRLIAITFVPTKPILAAKLSKDIEYGSIRDVDFISRIIRDILDEQSVDSSV